MNTVFGDSGTFYDYIGDNMGYPDPILEEVRWLKADLLRHYGGIEGLHKHQEEEQARLEKEGFKFVTHAEVRARKESQQNVLFSPQSVRP
ncbi:MAG: hypothetical protein LBT01_03665 [Spirochaetaceae bacterium]|jgi:hypothetical protein|nr:hypothetical protein [Spirochaetaceae bacterium]